MSLAPLLRQKIVTSTFSLPLISSVSSPKPNHYPINYSLAVLQPIWSNFEFGVFREVCALLGLHKTCTTPLNPQSDGIVERFNQTIENQLANFVQDHQRDWDQHIPSLLTSYRTAEFTPAMLFGRELRIPLSLFIGRPPEEAKEGSYPEYVKLRESVETYEFTKDQQHSASQRMKTRNDMPSK